MDLGIVRPAFAQLHKPIIRRIGQHPQCNESGMGNFPFILMVFLSGPQTFLKRSFSASNSAVISDSGTGLMDRIAPIPRLSISSMFKTDYPQSHQSRPGVLHPLGPNVPVHPAGARQAPTERKAAEAPVDGHRAQQRPIRNHGVRSVPAKVGGHPGRSGIV